MSNGENEKADGVGQMTDGKCQMTEEQCEVAVEAGGCGVWWGDRRVLSMACGEKTLEKAPNEANLGINAKQLYTRV